MLPPTVAILGPTASGKTGLACQLADRLKLHLISCDAVGVYRDLRAATAKPQGGENRHVWALIDGVEPARDVNLGDWVREAEQEVRWAGLAGRIPLVVGGTGLYLRGLAKGVAEAPARHEPTRERLAGLERRRGAGFLHRVLARLDPPAAASIMAGDRQRIVRALEVRLLTGRPLSALHGEGWRGRDRLPLLRIGLELPREELYRRIDARVERFLDQGLIDEVRWLLDARGLSRERNCLRAIGYREVAAYLAGEGPEKEEQLRALIQRNTRRFARRQLTWFRKLRGVIWVDPRESGLADRLAGRIEGFAREGRSQARTIGYTGGDD